MKQPAFILFNNPCNVWPLVCSFFVTAHYVCMCMYVFRGTRQDFFPREPWPAKILSKASIFVQPALACTPCCTPSIADGRESPAWFPETTSGAQILSLVFSLFSSVFFFSMSQTCCCKMWLQKMSNRKKIYYLAVTITFWRMRENCRTRLPSVWLNGTKCYCCKS